MAIKKKEMYLIRRDGTRVWIGNNDCGPFPFDAQKAANAKQLPVEVIDAETGRRVTYVEPEEPPQL